MQKSLFINFIKQDLFDRYSGSILGGCWAFIMPLVNIMIFVLVFSKIMGARLELFGQAFSEYNYSIYLVTGIVAWTALANTISRVTTVFSDKSSLIGKVNISLAVLPLYIVCTEMIIFIISYAFFMAFILLIDFPISLHIVLIPLVFLVQQLMAYAIGFVCAVLGVFLKDIKELVSVLLQLWFWLTPIVYVVTILPESVRAYFMVNPVFHIMEAYRDLLMYQRLPDIEALMYITMGSLVLMVTGIVLLKKLERDIRDMI